MSGTEKSATTNRGNKFAPCPHDPAGSRKDECVKCYPPERYLGLSGNLLITEKKPEMTARQWLINGGGGFEDGEEGILACTMSAEHAIELMDKFTARLQAELRASKSAVQLPVLEIYQHDWTPGWTSFLEDGSIAKGSRAHATLNLGSCLVAVESGELPAKDLPYLIAESIMHEAIHALESWAKTEFSEERVEALLEKYRKQYRPHDEVHWQQDPEVSRDNSNRFAVESELRDAKQLLIAEIEKTSRLERELVEAQLERDKSRRALERIRICNTVAATIAIAEARIRELEGK